MLFFVASDEDISVSDHVVQEEEDLDESIHSSLSVYELADFLEDMGIWFWSPEAEAVDEVDHVGAFHAFYIIDEFIA